MIRVAAVGDIHFGTDSAGRLRPHLEQLQDRADLLVIAGDVTTCGGRGEANVLAAELRSAGVPVLAVLGNHDYHSGHETDVRRALEGAGVQVLEGESAVVQVNGSRVGVAGVKGFGGGFAGACGTEFGEPEMKAFIHHTRSRSERLEGVLAGLDADVRIALLHYAPVKATLLLVLHGHAHRGTEKGVTPGGIHVRNVAQPVIRHAYNVYVLDGDG